jgi:hypothetical protein
MALPILAGGALALSKRNENKRKQAAANEYSKKYPLVDNIDSMESSLEAAKSELKNLKNMVAKTAGAKRVKARNSFALTEWTSIMNGHIKDLKSGMNVASSESVSPVVIPSSNKELPIPEKVPQGTENSPEATNDENLPKADNKKGVNWFLIGGVAIGAFVIYKLIKK